MVNIENMEFKANNPGNKKNCSEVLKFQWRFFLTYNVLPAVEERPLQGRVVAAS
jgi:hypothetical protein